MYLTPVILPLLLLNQVSCHLPTREDDQKQVQFSRKIYWPLTSKHMSASGVSGSVQVHGADWGREDAQVRAVLAGGHDQAAAHMRWPHRGLSRKVNTQYSSSSKVIQCSLIDTEIMGLGLVNYVAHEIMVSSLVQISLHFSGGLSCDIELDKTCH